jgi:hypothetical protein
MHNLKEEHIDVVLRIIWYLKGIQEKASQLRNLFTRILSDTHVQVGLALLLVISVKP